MIIRQRFDDLYRFSELQKCVGLVKHMLSSRLKALADIVPFEIRPASENWAYGEDMLTHQGRTICPTCGHRI